MVFLGHEQTFSDRRSAESAAEDELVRILQRLDYTAASLRRPSSAAAAPSKAAGGGKMTRMTVASAKLGGPALRRLSFLMSDAR